jgi:hypothetical protein
MSRIPPLPSTCQFMFVAYNEICRMKFEEDTPLTASPYLLKFFVFFYKTMQFLRLLEKSFFQKIKVWILEEVTLGSLNYLPIINLKNYSPSFHEIHEIIAFKHHHSLYWGSFMQWTSPLQNSWKLGSLPSFWGLLYITSKASWALMLQMPPLDL